MATILEKKSFSQNDFHASSYVKTDKLLKIVDDTEYGDALIKVFGIDTKKSSIIKVGNAVSLLHDLLKLDEQCQKIDILSMIKDVNLLKMLEGEKAIFEILNVSDEAVKKLNKSDILITETRYSAKNDILDYHHFSRFANYCRDLSYHDLVKTVVGYLKVNSDENKELKKLRLLYKLEDKAFYLRAWTSPTGYKDFGINFSVFVALISLSKYVESSGNEVFINNYQVDDSTLYVSFALNKQEPVPNTNLALSFNLILENDEIKRSPVSFNGIFKLEVRGQEKDSAIYLKPKGYIGKNSEYPTDLLSYQHRGNVQTVFDRIKDLPQLIEFYIQQVSEDTKEIAKIKKPNDVKEMIARKTKLSKKPEFQKYKAGVFNKLMSISVDSMYQLFELLRQVEELFEHDDVVSKDFWRSKLYESLTERK